MYSRPMQTVDPLERSRRRLAYLDEELKRDDLPPELHRKSSRPPGRCKSGRCGCGRRRARTKAKPRRSGASLFSTGHLIWPRRKAILVRLQTDHGVPQAGSGPGQHRRLPQPEGLLRDVPGASPERNAGSQPQRHCGTDGAREDHSGPDDLIPAVYSQITGGRPWRPSVRSWSRRFSPLSEGRGVSHDEHPPPRDHQPDHR